MANTNVSLDLELKTQVIDELQLQLANYQVFYAKLQNFHWHIKGRHFFELHQKFEEMYDSVFEKIDATAERIVGLGGRANGTLAEYLKLSTLDEASTESSEEEMVTQIIEDLETVIAAHRNAIEACESEEGHSDEFTIDMLVGFLRDLEKDLWMLTQFNQ